jgi:ADP-ribosyl-[dinitrogen reductase] hydrolase
LGSLWATHSGRLRNFDHPDHSLRSKTWSAEGRSGSDDTSMALCLVECRRADSIDQLHRFVRRYREEHLNSRGRCFEIGTTVSSALRRFEATGEPDRGSIGAYSAGNGSIMRLASVPLNFVREPREAIARAAESSRTAHSATEASMSADTSPDSSSGLWTAARTRTCWRSFLPRRRPLGQQTAGPRIAEIASGSFRRREPPEIRGSGRRHLRRGRHPPRMAGTIGDGRLHRVNGRAALRRKSRKSTRF